MHCPGSGGRIWLVSFYKKLFIGLQNCDLFQVSHNIYQSVLSCFSIFAWPFESGKGFFVLSFQHSVCVFLFYSCGICGISPTATLCVRFILLFSICHSILGKGMVLSECLLLSVIRTLYHLSVSNKLFSNERNQFSHL